MADDDDTSAGLTPAKDSTTTRRRASRTAGPPKDAAAPTGGNPASTANIAERTPAPAATSGDVPALDDGAQKTPVSPSPAPGSPAPDDEARVPGLGDTPVSEAVAEPSKPANRGRRLAVIGGVAVLVVALVVAGIVLLIDRNAADERDAKRVQFDQVARQTVLNLTTIKPETAKEDVERILAGASGDFKAEFDGRQDPFVSVVKEAGVTTVGKIIESGIQNEDGDTARVLVAARADVSTPDNTQNGPRDFRMRVTVTDDGGTMTASKVEFVP